MLYTSTFNAIRGFRRQFPHLANLSDEMVRCDFVNREKTSDGDRWSISLEAVADYEADRLGELKAARYLDVPAVRRSTKRKGATARARAIFAALPAGTARKDAVLAAVEAGIAYCTARTQYQVWKAA